MKVIIVALHPDDETIGCGGTLLKHKAEGDDIYWLIITNVDENFGWSKEIVQKRQEEIEEVSGLYGFSKVFKLNFPTARLDTIPRTELISSISKVFNEVKPEIVYLPNRSDVHTDHQIGFQAAYSCTKNFRYPCIKRVLMYEVSSETDFAPASQENSFIPTTFIEISEYFDKKTKIFDLYKSEVMIDNLPRSHSTIKSLNRFRGSRIGCKYAESFMLLFEKL